MYSAMSAHANTDAVDRQPLHCRVDGISGEAVVCLHSSTGSQAQWRGLAGQLAERCRVYGFDLHGHGRSPQWPAGAGHTLLVDAGAVLERMRREDGVHLVGHSYGGAVALQIALRYPQWVRSLTVYEPVAFGLIHRHASGDDSLDEIEGIAQSVRLRVEQGDLDGASERFVDYWAGAGAWRRLDPAQQAVVMSRVPTVPHHFDGCFAATWGRAALARLQMPVLLMHGARTRAPARRIVELLGDALGDRARRAVFEQAAHLGPITHEREVNAAIVPFVREQLGPASAADDDSELLLRA